MAKRVKIEKLPKVETPPVLRVTPDLLSSPGLEAAWRMVRDEVGKRIGREALRKTFEDVLVGKTSLDQVLSALVDDAQKLVDKALAEEEHVEEQEAKVGAQLEEALIERRREKRLRRLRRARKSEYVLRGRLSDSKSGEPIAGMVVEAIGELAEERRVLALDVTDRKGRYQIALRPEDLGEEGEAKPKVRVRAAVDREAPLPVLSQPVSLELGKVRELDVALPKENAEAVARVTARRESLDAARLARLRRSAATRGLQRQYLQALGGGVKELLAEAAGRLSGEAGRAAEE